jgi:hypothetical protein
VNDDRRPAGDPAHDVGLTAVAVNKDGVVGVMWEDRRNSANNLDYEIRFAASFDGGMTFTPSVRVSEQPRVVGAGETWIASRRPLNEDAKPDPFVATLTVRRDEWVNAGHTMGLTATVDGSFHPVWVDNRTGINQLWTAAIGVHGTPMKNGAADLAMLEDVTGKSLLEMTNVSWDRGRNELTVTARLKNASKATITGPLKLRALELNSVLGRVVVAHADNGVDGEGAVFDFSNQLTGNTIEPNGWTQPRALVFRFPEMPAKPFFVGKEFKSEWLTMRSQVLAGSAQMAIAKE